MFHPIWTREARKQYDELEKKARRAFENRTKRGRKKSSKQEGLFKQVRKTIQRLANDPRHPGLNTHEYRSIPHPYKKGEKVFEAYAQNKTPGAYRIFFCYGPNKKQITILTSTPHP